LLIALPWASIAVTLISDRAGGTSFRAEPDRTNSCPGKSDQYFLVTTVTLLLLQAGVNGSSCQQLDRRFASFSRLQPKTAQTALQFYRMREKASWSA
jgi:hypothetical protein